MAYEVFCVNTPDHLKDHLKRFGEAGWKIEWMHYCAGQYVVVLFNAGSWRTEAVKACKTDDQERVVKALIESVTVGTREGISDEDRRDAIRNILSPVFKANGTAKQDVGVSTTQAKTVQNGTASTPRITPAR